MRVGLAVACAWLLHPALSPAHVEGFSASIVSVGLHVGQGDVSAYDRLHPANLEFFGLSRLGTALSVTLFAAIPGVGGDAAMRATMWIAFAVLAWASFTLVRRWTGAGGAVAAASLLVVPGVAETAFFFNDNVLSSALAVASLAVVGSSQRLAVTARAGLLFGAAMVARFDAVLLAPAVPLIAFGQHGLGRTFYLRAAVFTGCVLVPLVGVLGAFH
ncbi:MAG TPA: glycosyltransferase family 39 protein, partial [Longimicrobiaceae bacterium]|nr:glycosyltransferase family 39 protein [Longimicrobiaceae bacterium]